MERMRMVFTGSGGQGVITAAIIFAEAAVIYEGLNATQSQAYGAEARGGATRSDVIISDTEIYYPKLPLGDVGEVALFVDFVDLTVDFDTHDETPRDAEWMTRARPVPCRSRRQGRRNRHSPRH